MGKGISKIGLVLVLTAGMLLPATSNFAAVKTNRMLSMQTDLAGRTPVLRITTEKSVGYRYTVYEAFAPSRIVITFPHMDTDAVSPLINVHHPQVQNVDVSSYDAAWGRMTRVEVVLFEMADYDVSIEGNEFMLTLLLKEGYETAAAIESVSNESKLRAPSLNQVKGLKTASAATIVSVEVGERGVTLQADGVVDSYKYFSLVDPDRLVVDIYDVKPGFEARHFPLTDDFSRMRVGVYREKLRFVLDASGKVPGYEVVSAGESVVISWGEK